ncbi:MAG TPA: hypothetical protein VE732_05240 [Nitrososphaera sp.]|nr:hypothetical protein [Nitrososphaera sp.]
MNEQLKFKLYEEELLDPLRGHALTEIERFIASLLLDATTDKPIGIAEIIRAYAAHSGKRISDRIVKGIIRRLRKEHAFPILARRSKKPTGYWWCGSAAEMEMFIESFRSQALDELHTLSTIIKHNYPALLGQLKFDET